MLVYVIAPRDFLLPISTKPDFLPISSFKESSNLSPQISHRLSSIKYEFFFKKGQTHREINRVAQASSSQPVSLAFLP